MHGGHVAQGPEFYLHSTDDTLNSIDFSWIRDIVQFHYTITLEGAKHVEPGVQYVYVMSSVASQ